MRTAAALGLIFAGGAGWWVASCSGAPTSTPLPAERDGSAAFDGGQADAQPAPLDGGDSGLPRPLSRGLLWVRKNPMFISALNVQMSGVDVAAANDYFDGLHANAVHLWATGLPAEVDAWRAARPTSRWVAWVDPSGKSRANSQLLGGYDAGVPGRIGYQIGDEPTSQQTFDEMVAGVRAVHAADPDALTILNYAPSPDPAWLDQHATVAKADIYSYDDYSRKKGTYKSLAALRAAGLKYNLPYWRYLRAYTDAGSTPEVDESDCRWDAFLGLVYGFTGHTWFVYEVISDATLVPALFRDGGSFVSPKTSTFAVVGQINVELANLGRAITQLTSTGVRYIPALAYQQPQGTETWAAGAGGDPFMTRIGAGAGSGSFPEILVGFFTDDANERYVMVENVRHAHGEFPVASTQALVAEIDFDFGASAVDATRVSSLSRTSGLVEDLPLTSQGGRRARLSATLDAGNVLLFKYATGQPFKLGP